MQVRRLGGGQFLLNLWQCERLGRLRIEASDDRTRRLGRHQHAVPVIEIGIIVSASRVVGRSGRVGERLAELTASGTPGLFWMNGSPDEMPIKMKSTRPVITSVSASGPPRKGTCVAFDREICRTYTNNGKNSPLEVPHDC